MWNAFFILFYFVSVGDCTAGFWCISGSSVAEPTDGITGKACPEGHYCTTGTPAPTPCPTGTMSNSTGLSNSGQCPACQGGFYCATTGLITPTGPCNAGYYCDSGADTPTPNDGTTGDVCPVGNYCPLGTDVPIQCPVGTFMATTQASECMNCTAGYYCVDGLNLIDCPQGYFCPTGTGNVTEMCPAGTYGGSVKLAAESDCTQCTGGSYCDIPGLTAVVGGCDAGYFCTSGSDSATPSGSVGNAGICPAGHYCGASTVNPTPCPVGYYSNTTGLTLSSQCTLCDYGKYCGSTGLIEPTGDCDAGFFCLEGATVPNNPTVDATSGPCPVGHYCPVGTSFPLGCDAGTYRFIIYEYHTLLNFWCNSFS